MDKVLNYEFDYMYEDELCATIRVYRDGTLTVEDFTDDIVKKPFGKWGDRATMDDLYDFYRYRCFPETRANAKQVWESGGFDYYDVLGIVIKNEGRMSDDLFWLKFRFNE